MTQTLIEQLEKLIRTGGVAGIFRESSHVVLSSDLRAIIEQHKQGAPVSGYKLVPNAYIEAAEDVLQRAPCECSHKRRYEDGEHLSGCHLFDLNIASVELQLSPQPDIVAELVKALEDDAYAATFQSMAGYRTALIAKVKG